MPMSSSKQLLPEKKQNHQDESTGDMRQSRVHLSARHRRGIRRLKENTDAKHDLGEQGDASFDDVKGGDSSSKHSQKRTHSTKRQQKARDKYAFKLFDVDEVKSILSPTDEIGKFPTKKPTVEEVLGKLTEHGGYVQRRALPQDFMHIMDDMDASFPHFKHVTQCLRQRMQLKACHAYPVLHFSINILLDGPAGVGKSAYLLELSQKLGTLFYSINCATASNGMDLMGLSSRWSNGRHGKIHDLLFNQECPNPIILLDEVEKSSKTNSPFTNVLYGLLEKNNAKVFKDEFVDITMDASLINWFATSNYIDRLDAPIRDRFEVLTVNAPNTNDLRIIVPNMYKKIVRGHGLEAVFAARLSPDVVEKLALSEGISMRRIGSALEAALAHAVGRSHDVRKSRRKVKLEVSDVPDVDSNQLNEQQPIGFIWGP